ncbi:MAG: orotidine-5'-phosphate decarboxylase [SAR202 cluster bacterium]|nr:orotidine-5'-phosphate decarboxylase [SAR202 cluster bacterium]
MSAFAERLDQACLTTKSLLCVGLDVDPACMPAPDVLQFNRAIVNATSDLACAYKPNLAFYEALGLPGLEALARTVEYIHTYAPHAVIIGDGKRGDIGPSAQAYAKAMFHVWGFDAITINAWGGQDTVSPFLEDPSRGVFIWCRGSNPGSADLQDLALEEGLHGTQHRVPVYQRLASLAQRWNSQGNLGLVVGATVPAQLAAVRRLCPDMPLLIPGVGAQGGDLEEAVRLGVDVHGRGAIINASRSIIYASKGPDFPAAARLEASRIRDAIAKCLEAEGKGWP